MGKYFYVAGGNNRLRVSNKKIVSNDGEWEAQKGASLDVFCRCDWTKLTGIKVPVGKQVRVDISNVRFSIVDECKERKLNVKDHRRLRLLKEKACIKIKAKKPFYLGADDINTIVVSEMKMEMKNESIDDSGNSNGEPEWNWSSGNEVQEEIANTTMDNIFGFHVPWGVQICVSPRSMKSEKI